nr:hypothetical protein [Verrucomicrobiota bacterium]
SFRGSPRDFSKATARVYLLATNFQWESRQWDSLELGTELIERRLQVHKLALRQGKNQLDLTGDLALPTAGREWWQSEFRWNIAAKIENLTELSALMLPEFKYAAGTVSIDGSVRGKDERFHGQLIVTGSGLQWRDTPFDELHAALKLDGNEAQVTNVSIFNHGDFIRGRGKFNILGEKNYSGELRATVRDLAAYAAILQKPIFPEPLTGGALVEWSGDGSARGHRGKFLGHLREVRSMGAAAPHLHPIDADLEGTYEAGQVLFTRFSLSDDDCAFVANVAIGPSAVNLQAMRLTHGGQVWLEGDALLPINIWLAWPTTSISTSLNHETVGRVNLKASNLQLGHVAQLTGWKFPIEGAVDGNITAAGRLGEFHGSGRLALSNGRVTLGRDGDALTGVHIEACLRGQEAVLEKCTATHRFLDFTLDGPVGLQDVCDPLLKLTLRSERVALPLFRAPADDRTESLPGDAPQMSFPRHIEATMAVDLLIEGPLSGALVQGRAELIGLSLGGAPDLSGVWTPGRPVQMPPVFSLPTAPWNAWRFEIECRSKTPITLEDDMGTLAADVRLLGTGRAPALTGTIHVEDAAALAGATAIRVDEAHLEFREAQSTNPSLDLCVRANLFGEECGARAAGPLSHVIRTYTANPPLTLPAVQRFFAGTVESGQPLGEDRSFSLRIDLPSADGVVAFDWPLIENPLPVSADRSAGAHMPVEDRCAPE